MEGGGEAGHQAPPHHLMDQVNLSCFLAFIDANFSLIACFSCQIRTLSDLQGAAALQAADPSLQVNLSNRKLHNFFFNLSSSQAAYIAKLHQQAASIKNLLKLLNAGEAGLNNPGDLAAVANGNAGSFESVSESCSNNNVNLNFANFAPTGSVANAEESVYESLWETGSSLRPSVNEVEDPMEEEARASDAEGEVKTCF